MSDLEIPQSAQVPAKTAEKLFLPPAPSWYPDGTVIPVGGIPGVTSRTVVQISPEVEHAFPAIKKAFGKATYSAENGLEIDTASLRNYFGKPPGEFGEKLLNAIESKNLIAVAKVLRENNLVLINSAFQGEKPLLNVGKVDTILHLSPTMVENRFNGWLATPKDELKVMRVSGLETMLKHDGGQKVDVAFAGFTTIDLASGKPAAYIFEGMSRWNEAAIIQDEITHIEIVYRKGAKALHGEHIGGNELMSFSAFGEIAPDQLAMRLANLAIDVAAQGGEESDKQLLIFDQLAAKQLGLPGTLNSAIKNALTKALMNQSAQVRGLSTDERLKLAFQSQPVSYLIEQIQNFANDPNFRKQIAQNTGHPPPPPLALASNIIKGILTVQPPAGYMRAAEEYFTLTSKWLKVDVKEELRDALTSNNIKRFEELNTKLDNLAQDPRFQLALQKQITIAASEARRRFDKDYLE